MRRQYLAGLGLLLLLFPGCRTPSRGPTSEPTNSAALTPKATPEPRSNSNPTPERFTFEIPYTKDKLSYSGYEITIERKRVRVEEFTAENEVAALKRNGRVIRTFDAVRHPLGAFTRMALTPVLGGEDKQLIVEQTGPRDWAYWVVDLKPQFRVVFTNTVYPVGHELGLDDLDGDGIKELLMHLHTFWFFDGLCGACSPRFGIAFRYDQKRGVFQPANHILNGFCDTAEELGKAEETIKLWLTTHSDLSSDRPGTSELYEKVLNHSLPLLYCGKENDGWSFFDRLYNLPDRAVRKSRIKRMLRDDRVYRFIENDLRRTGRAASMHRAQLSR